MKRVLIVDDAAFMRNTLKIILQTNGFEVVGEAENGSVAIHKYNELKPDIVTMDITMPKMDGIEALSIIRTNDCTASVVMITALGQEVYIRKAFMQGAKGFIVKPWIKENVIQLLNSI